MDRAAAPPLELLGHHDVAPEVRETHISTVVFLGDAVLKLKKPVAFPFLDQRDVSRRAELCHQEVLLNRRLAPDVYLGVGELRLPLSPPEPVVTMRRLPEDRRLEVLVRAADPDLPDLIDDVALRLATFHAEADRSLAVMRNASAAAVCDRWRTNFVELAAAFGDAGIEPGESPPDPEPGSVDLVGIARLAETFLSSHASMLDERSAHACDGHGDLRAEDVFCLPDGPRIIDCLDFDERLRWADVAEDIAFLVMDLDRLDPSGLAQSFVRAYEQSAGEHFSHGLVDYHVAYRAAVRAKVTALRLPQTAEQEQPRLRREALSFLDQCRRRLVRAQGTVVLVGGLPGTGKSTIAAALAARTGWPVVRSDVVRTQVFGSGIGNGGTGDSSAFGAGRYEPDAVDAVYRATLTIAETELQRAGSVIIDASFGTERHRALGRALADRHGVAVRELRCTIDAEEAASRIERRREEGRDPSEATAEVARHMAAAAEPWPRSIELPTDASPGAAADRAMAVLTDGAPGPRPIRESSPASGAAR